VDEHQRGVRRTDLGAWSAHGHGITSKRSAAYRLELGVHMVTGSCCFRCRSQSAPANAQLDVIFSHYFEHFISREKKKKSRLWENPRKRSNIMTVVSSYFYFFFFLFKKCSIKECSIKDGTDVRRFSVLFLVPPLGSKIRLEAEI
jgi:hypothetical protein